MTTPLDVIVKAHQKIGAVTRNQTLTSGEAQDGLEALNSMVGSWSTESNLRPPWVSESFPLVSSVGVYTIGSGGNFNTTRPERILSMYVNEGGLDHEVTEQSVENYNTLPLKDTPGTPEVYVYDNAFPLARIRLYPVPQTTSTLTITSEKGLSGLTLYQSISLPDGWIEALIYNLAIRLAPDFGQSVTPEIAALASRSLGAIKRANRRKLAWKRPITGGNPVLTGGYY